MCASLGRGGAGAATTALVTGTSAAPAVLASPVSASRTLTAMTNGPDGLEARWRLSNLGSLRGMFGCAPEAAGEARPARERADAAEGRPSSYVGPPWESGSCERDRDPGSGQ